MAPGKSRSSASIMPMTCSAMGMACTPLALVTTIPRVAQLGIHQLRDAGGGASAAISGGAPSRNCSGRSRVTHENIGVGQFRRELIEAREVHDAHLGPALAHALGQLDGRAPQRELEVDENDELGVRGATGA